MGTGFAFDNSVLEAALKRIYSRDFHPMTDIEQNLFHEFLRTFNTAADQGFSKSVDPDDDFRAAIRHGNAVFSAFKTHRLQNDMAARLLDENGDLKPFKQWKKDVQSIASHQCGAWLRTEYDTAVIRARQAADWKQFERERDILPNLKWLPSTSLHPGEDHRPFWGTILPIGHPFWSQHRPGDRWNCKCDLTSTNEPPTKVPGETEKDNPHRGLDNNPGKDEALFSNSHPYYPSDCRHCPFYKPGRKARLSNVFLAQAKDCNHCQYVGKVISEEKQRVDVTEALRQLTELTGAEYIRKMKEIANMKIYKQVEKNILSAISSESPDYDALMAGAQKAVRHGYKVFLLPNPKGVRSADYIFVRKGVYKMYDLKTVTGTGSLGTRLEESIGQTNRVFLNLNTTYPANRMATEIKQYFEANDEALEVLVAVGNKFVSVQRNFVMKRSFFKEFRKSIEQ